MKRIDDILRLTEQKGDCYALCVIVDTKGSTPAKAGAKMLVYPDGSIKGTIGGGELERNVILNAIKCLKDGKPQLYKHDLLHEHSMCCGGTTIIYIEPQMTSSKLYIFGAGHTGQVLATLAGDLSFEIFVIDERKEYLDKINGEHIFKMNLPMENALKALKFDTDTYICIMTHDHALDRLILAHCLHQPHSYLGMIGSSRKVALTNKIFLESGFADESLLKKIHMPIGLAIKAATPKEIAISILAQLIETKNTTT